MTPIRAVIFDFGGVLVRSESEAGRRKWEMRLGLPEGGAARLVFDSEIAARATIGLAPYAAIWAYVAATLKLDAAQLEEFKRDFWGGDQLDRELFNFVGSLRPRCKTAILSNAWLNARRMFVEKYHFDAIADELIISSEEGARKPDARLYQAALERLRVAPEEAVFVDDFLENILGARRVGLNTVHFKNTPQAISDVRWYLSRTTEAA